MLPKTRGEEHDAQEQLDTAFPCVSASSAAHESACFGSIRLLHNAMMKDEVDVRKEGYTLMWMMKDEET